MVVLGSTGSIGTNTLNIARDFNLEVEVLVAGSNVELLQQQIDEFKPKTVVIGSKDLISKISHNNVLVGEEGTLEAIRSSRSDLVVNALVGFLGLKPTIEAIECGKRVALANKESLVAAGSFVDISKIHPIDSEHFGIWYLLSGRKVDSLTITASGGALRDYPLDRVKTASLQEVLKHPNWSMGSKITIDSATMTNKIFEILEAFWLFGMPKVDAVIERSSTIHAMVQFADGSTTAQLSSPDMKLPIAYALLGKVEKQIVKPLDLINTPPISFEAIDPDRYPVWQLRLDLINNPKLGVVVNAANEAAIKRYLAKEIAFGDISRIILSAYEHFRSAPKSLDEVFAIDSEVREWAKNI